MAAETHRLSSPGFSDLKHTLAKYINDSYVSKEEELNQTEIKCGICFGRLFGYEKGKKITDEAVVHVLFKSTTEDEAYEVSDIYAIHGYHKTCLGHMFCIECSMMHSSLNPMIHCRLTPKNITLSQSDLRE